MDEEDLADLEESRQLKTESAFAGLGSTVEDTMRKDALIDLFRPSTNETIGVQLLQKMGWKPGQGIGRMVKRKAKLSDGRDENGELHVFAPTNSKMISFVKKDDYKGLGFAGEAKLTKPKPVIGKEDEDEDDSSLIARSKARFTKGKAKPMRTSFGVGAGSEDEDPCDAGPKISIKRSIRPSAETSSSVVKPTLKKLSANPAISARPTFKSGSTLLQQSSARLRKCHDGMLPLKGFILSSKSQDSMAVAYYEAPKIPAGWKSTKSSTSTNSQQANEPWQSFADAAKSSKLTPSARGEILGEEALKSKSVFDYITPEAREKMIAATGRTDLPRAKGEAPPEASRKSDNERLWDLVPPLDKPTAISSLQRGASGFMPYDEDEAKQERYKGFLSLKAGFTDQLPDRPMGMSKDDWSKELQEFAQAAQVFKPMTGLLANRFVSSKKGVSGNAAGDDSNAEEERLKRPEDPAEQAALLGMFGPMTRSVEKFYPTRLLCKRFGVKPPSHVTANTNVESAEANKVEQPVGKRDMEQMRWYGRTNMPTSGAGGDGMDVDAQMPLMRQPAAVSRERNEAIEGKRASDEQLKAVFGDDY